MFVTAIASLLLSQSAAQQEPTVTPVLKPPVDAKTLQSIEIDQTPQKCINQQSDTVDRKHSQEAKEAAREKRKENLDRIQKFLDILRTMCPTI